MRQRIFPFAIPISYIFVLLGGIAGVYLGWSQFVPEGIGISSNSTRTGIENLIRGVLYLVLGMVGGSGVGAFVGTILTRRLSPLYAVLAIPCAYFILAIALPILYVLSYLLLALVVVGTTFPVSDYILQFGMVLVNIPPT